jgi:hypothetical protein
VSLKSSFGLGPGGQGFGQLIGQVYVVGFRVGGEANRYFLANS